jgi:hypothetical protein
MQAESTTEAQAAYRAISAQSSRLEALARRGAELEVVARSSLAGDARATPYSPLSTQALHHLASASDHLNTVVLMVRPDGQLAVPAMALHTMVRAAVEATATAAWLLLPAARDERVLRSLRLTYDNRRQLRTILSERGLEDPKFEKMARRLEAIRDERPRLRGVELGKRTLDTNTTRLEEAGVLVGPEVPTPLEVWRMTSGIAHGNSSIALNVLEMSLSRKVEGGDDKYTATAHLGMLAMFFVVAVNFMEATVDLVEERNTPP